MASLVSKALSIVLPKRPIVGGQSLTGTYTPSNANSVLAIPQYQNHLQDIYATRAASDSRTLIQLLATTDPDVSGTFSAYLTIANTELVFQAKNPLGQIDTQGMALVQSTLLSITKQFDYTLGFDYKPSVSTISENMRYMLMMRGAIGSELVFDKNLSPIDIRQMDPASLFWWEKTTGNYKPEQRVSGQILELDNPAFFMAFHHRDPTTIYTDSSFVSAINTIAARQQVINDLYRIMMITGYPRLDVQVLEEVVIKNAPENIKKDANALNAWKQQQLSAISSAVQNIRPDQAFVHFDSVQAQTTNDKAPAMSLDITPIITVLNAQNQAALKVMGTVIGRGESGVNTASVEARVFCMNCDELNKPVAEIWSNIMTLALRLQGFQGYVDAHFLPAELRPSTELEPQLTMRAARLKEDLSLGLITDMEYHLKMYNRPPPDGAPTLQGTGFMQPQTSNGMPDADAAAPANGPGDQPNAVTRAATPPGSKAVKSNTVKKAA